MWDSSDENYNPTALKCVKESGTPTCKIAEGFQNSPQRCITGFHPDDADTTQCVADDLNHCGGQKCTDVFPEYTETALSCDAGTCKKADSLAGLDEPCKQGYHVSTDEQFCETNDLEKCGTDNCFELFPEYTEFALKCDGGTCMKKYDNLQNITGNPCKPGNRLSDDFTECLPNNTKEHCGIDDVDCTCEPGSYGCRTGFKDPKLPTPDSVGCYYGRCVSTACVVPPARYHANDDWLASDTGYCIKEELQYYNSYVTYFSGKEVMDLEAQFGFEIGTTLDFYTCVQPSDTFFCGNSPSTATKCTGIEKCLKRAPQKDACKSPKGNSTSNPDGSTYLDCFMTYVCIDETHDQSNSLVCAHDDPGGGNDV